MRTLTQVWVFFVSLTFILLISGFMIAGRVGLVAAFLLGLIIIYATLHRGLALFKKHLKVKEWTGSDPSGFFNLLQTLKKDYNMTHVMLHYTNEPTPPLVWKNDPTTGHILVHQDLLNHLNASEKKILAHFVLSHLKERSFLIPRILSIFEQGFWGLNYLFAPFITLFTFIIRMPSRLLKADLRSMQQAQISSFEMGYFINKIHQFNFHKISTLKGGEFFSTLTLADQKKWKTYGLPHLKIRLINVMGFEP